MTYLICYDISNPKRLYKVAKTLESFGLRVQKSFFQLDISEKRLKLLINFLKEIIDEKKDKLYVYPICLDCNENVTIDGVGDLISLKDYQIL